MARRATDAESALWAAAMADVTPLRNAADRRPPAALVPAPPPATALAPPQASQPRRGPGPIDRATLDRLRQGKIPIEARIDLHGQTQAEAHAALIGFVDRSIALGRRAVLVITGKGSMSKGGGVIRRQAPEWLRAGPHAAGILAIQPAHVRHGGDGAFYILFRRKR